MNRQKFGAITSSTNPEEIATRVKGIVLSVSSVIIFLAANNPWFQVHLNPGDMIEIASQLGIAAGAITSVYGVGMWILAKIFKHDQVQ